MVESYSLLKSRLRRNEKIEVRRSAIHRWGVYSTGTIDKYDLLEEAPYFELPNEQAEAAPECDRYTYWLTEDSMLVGMGYAGLYNHSKDPNAGYEIDYINEIIRHYALRVILPEQEITLDYGKDNVERFNLT